MPRTKLSRERLFPYNAEEQNLRTVRLRKGEPESLVQALTAEPAALVSIRKWCIHLSL